MGLSGSVLTTPTMSSLLSSVTRTDQGCWILLSSCNASRMPMSSSGSRLSFINSLTVLLILIHSSAQFSFIANRQSEATAWIVDNVAISDKTQWYNQINGNSKVEKEHVLCPGGWQHSYSAAAAIKTDSLPASFSQTCSFSHSMHQFCSLIGPLLVTWRNAGFSLVNWSFMENVATAADQPPPYVGIQQRKMKEHNFKIAAMKSLSHMYDDKLC